MKRGYEGLLLKDLCVNINTEQWMSLEDYPNEEWRDIEGFDNRYMVSNIGRVKTKEFTYTLYGKVQVKTEHIIKTIIRKDKYCKVNLGGYKKQKTLNLHHLVAIAFIPNPQNLPCIIHKDENPLNNTVENLEWCTYKYNNNYGIFKEKHSIAFKNHPSLSKPVIQMTLEGVEIQEFPSMAEAARQLGGCAINIKEYIEHSEYRNHAYGYKWKFKNTTT